MTVCESDNSSMAVYHGGRHKMDSIEPFWMYHGESNNQEGVGIYFVDDIDYAKSYGDEICKTYIRDQKLFIDSRGVIADFLDVVDINDLLVNGFMGGSDEVKEAFFYFMSDYIEVTSPDEIDDHGIEELANHLMDWEVRHFQNNLAEIFGVKFVELWNEYIPYVHGTRNTDKDATVFAIINTDYYLEEV